MNKSGNKVALFYQQLSNYIYLNSWQSPAEAARMREAGRVGVGGSKTVENKVNRLTTIHYYFDSSFLNIFELCHLRAFPVLAFKGSTYLLYFTGSFLTIHLP